MSSEAKSNRIARDAARQLGNQPVTNLDIERLERRITALEARVSLGPMTEKEKYHLNFGADPLFGIGDLYSKTLELTHAQASRFSEAISALVEYVQEKPIIEGEFRFSPDKVVAKARTAWEAFNE